MADTNGMDMIRSRLPDDETLYELANLFKMFGDPTRVKILSCLQMRDMCVGELAQALDMTDSAVSHQLRVLRTAKLVKGTKEGKEVKYSLDDDHVTKILEYGLTHVNEEKQIIYDRSLRDAEEQYNENFGGKIMKKNYKLEDLDCANCAAKMERAVAKIDGVNSVSISFMAQRMAIEADDARFEEIMDQVVKTCKKVEPDCRIIR